MVLREYRCLSCGKSVTILHKTSVEVVPDCEFCHGDLEKKLSSFSAITSGKFDSLDADYVASANKVEDKKVLLTYNKIPLALLNITVYECERKKNPNLN